MNNKDNCSCLQILSLVTLPNEKEKETVVSMFSVVSQPYNFLEYLSCVVCSGLKLYNYILQIDIMEDFNAKFLIHLKG